MVLVVDNFLGLLRFGLNRRIPMGAFMFALEIIAQSQVLDGAD
jgi:hypothetical protein